MLKVVGMAVVSAILITTLRRDAPSFSLMLSLAVLAVVFVYVGDALSALVSIGQGFVRISMVPERELRILLKVLAITILTKISGDFCKDAGSACLSGSVEVIGNVLALITATPLFEELLGFISSI